MRKIKSVMIVTKKVKIRIKMRNTLKGNMFS